MRKQKEISGTFEAALNRNQQYLCTECRFYTDMGFRDMFFMPTTEEMGEAYGLCGVFLESGLRTNVDFDCVACEYFCKKG